MENSLKNTQNFENVQKAHAIFLTNVMSRTFLISGDRVDKKNPVRLSESESSSPFATILSSFNYIPLYF